MDASIESEAQILHTSREWLTVIEAAQHAGGVGVSTIREACNRGELRHIRIGGRSRGPIRTRREWIDGWLEHWARGGAVE